MHARTSAHLALLGANLFYGAGFSVAKTIMPRLIEPNGFILIRVLSATLLFWFSFFGGKEFRQTIDKKDWWRLLACAFFGVASNQMLFFMGLKLTSPIQASLMMLSTPSLVSIFSAFLLREHFPWWRVLGLSLGVSGALMLILFGAKDQIASNPLLGDLLVFLNATSYAIYLIIVKPLMHKYRPIVVIRWVFLMGLMFVVPVGLPDLLRVEWTAFKWPDFAALAFIVIAVTFFTYLWNIYALRILSPSVAGAYIYLQPLFASLIAILFLRESLDWFKILAGLLIFTGVYLVGRKKAVQ